MNWNVIEPQIEKLKNGILTVMDKIEESTSSSSKLPEVSSAMTTARSLIEHPSYDVVVCGEVKKGKSSLLNAIVGQEILPVNNEIATSQVFRLTNSSTESFYLVFTDGTRKKISRDELSRYGSQVDANLQGEPIFQDHTLSYIQVNIPIAFLPEGVSLVDTPGLGALYKSHEWITQNYVSKASAVIFVMDPERPLVEKEKEFIQKVLGITPYILFAMTKIDMHAESVVNHMLERNRECLALIYAEKGQDAPAIFPLSSTALMDVVKSEDEFEKDIHLENSRFPQLKEQLLYTIYKAVGLQQTGLALREAADHTMKCKSVIDDILKVTTAENAQEQQRINAKKIERQNQLNAEWGTQSAKRKGVLDEIYAICNDTRNKANLLFSIDGSVFKTYDKVIKEIDTDEKLETVKQHLGNAVSEELDQEWSRIMEDAKSRVNEQLDSFATSIDRISYENGIGNDFSITEKKLTLMDYMPAIQKTFWVTTVTLALVSVFSGGWAILISTIAGLFMSSETKREKKKEALQKGLVDAFKDIRQKVVLESQPGKNRSVVDEFAYVLKTSAENAITEIFNRKENAHKQELADLEEQSRIEASQRQGEITKWTSAKTEWDHIVAEIKSLVAIRNELAQSLGIKTK